MMAATPKATKTPKAKTKPKATAKKPKASAASASQLNPKQRQFVREYLIDLNGTQAAIRAGYSEHTANEQASQLLAKLNIREAIQSAQDKRAERTQVTADRVVMELAAMALFDPIEIAQMPMTGPEDIAKLPEAVRRAIVGWGWDRAGNFTLKLSPKTPSLELLGRHLKMFTDKVEATTTLTVAGLLDLAAQKRYGSPSGS